MFSYFFPISGRRPEIPVLAGGQGPKLSDFNKGKLGGYVRGGETNHKNPQTFMDPHHEESTGH